MSICYCGQSFSTDLPWSDPEHDVLQCIKDFMAKAKAKSEQETPQ